MIAEIRLRAKAQGLRLPWTVRLKAIGFTYCTLRVPWRGNCATGFLLALAFVFSGRAVGAQSLGDYAHDFWNNTWTLETVWEPAISAGGSVAWNDFVSPSDGFGPCWQGYGHHYAVALGDNVNGEFMRDLPLQQPRIKKTITALLRTTGSGRELVTRHYAHFCSYSRRLIQKNQLVRSSCFPGLGVTFKCISTSASTNVVCHLRAGWHQHGRICRRERF